jgi:hypothetical protein
LKGGGPITDIEGKSATAAQNRVNEATDLPSYLRALEEVRTVVAKRVAKLGGQVPPIPTAHKYTRTNRYGKWRNNHEKKLRKIKCQILILIFLTVRGLQ